MMFSYPERLLAWRYMRAKRREGFVSVITAFSIIGIMLGVGTLILVTSLMNGVRQEMLANFIGLDGHISIYSNERPFLTGTDVLKAEVQKLPGVVSIIPRIEGQVMASARTASGAQVIGLTADDLAKKERISGKLSGEAKERFARGGMLAGERLVENLHVPQGGGITLISPQGRATVMGVVPRIKAYPVAASFKTGMHQIDGSLVILPYEQARAFFQIPEGDAASGLEITLDDQDKAEGLAKQLQQKLGQGYRVYSWQQSNQSVLTALKIQRDVMLVILTLIILVAAFNIISSLIMLVQDKAKEVAILRSMGATRGGVLRIFLLSGMSIGFVGTAAGVLLGLLASAYIDDIRKGLEVLLGQKILVENIYFLSSLPTKTDPVEVLVVALLAMALSFLSTLYPAWKAASYSPAEALRYD